MPSAAGSQRTARPRLRPLGVRVLAEPFSANVKVQARLVGTDAHVLRTERLFAAHTRSPRAPPRAPPQFRTASCGGRQRLNPGLLIVGATKALSPHLQPTPTPTPLPIPYPYPYPTPTHIPIPTATGRGKKAKVASKIKRGGKTVGARSELSPAARTASMIAGLDALGALR